MRTVLVVYPFMPHHRYGVFRALQRSARFTYIFASDPAPQSGIPALAASDVEHHLHLSWHTVAGVGWQSGLLRHLLAHRYDAVILVGDVTVLSTWLAAAMLRLRSTRVFFWTIGWHRPEAGAKRLVRLAFYKLAHALLLYGDVGRELGKSHGYAEDRMHVISNSHISPEPAPQQLEPPLDAAMLQSDQPVVGAVIRLNQVKRLDLLLEAAAELRTRGAPVTVVLAGDGPSRGHLEELARALGVDVRFLGPVYDPANIAAVYRAMRVTVVPAAVGLTAIQSMAHGVPVVTDDDRYGQMPEWESVRPGLTGAHYPKGDVMALADAITVWIARMTADATAVAEACRTEVAEHWSPGVQVQRIEAALSAALARSS
jgi:glycosyltransferase involved in cell wall biosynthesis